MRADWMESDALSRTKTDPKTNPKTSTGWSMEIYAAKKNLSKPFLRSHPLSSLLPFELTNHYAGQFRHLITTGNVFISDLSCIRLSPRLHTRWESFGVNFAAHEMTVLWNFQTILCSHNCTEEQISYQLIRSAKRANQVIYASDALLSWTKHPVAFLPHLLSHSYV